MRFRSRDLEGTRDAALALAAAVRDAPERGLILALSGPLGAGKTQFVKGLAEGLGIDPDAVSSPTFVIVNQYAARWGRFVHVDLYRLARAQELDDAGFLDLLTPGAVVAIEWADRFPAALPRDRLDVRLERPKGAEGSRGFTVSATGEGSRTLLERWSRLLAARRPGEPA